jgi:hypothetical protein
VRMAIFYGLPVIGAAICWSTALMPRLRERLTDGVQLASAVVRHPNALNTALSSHKEKQKWADVSHLRHLSDAHTCDVFPSTARKHRHWVRCLTCSAMRASSAVITPFTTI